MNSGSVRRVTALFRPSGGFIKCRQLQTASVLQNSGFFGSFFERKVEQQQQPHSNQFAKKEKIIEVHSHSVKPDSIDKYLKNQETFQGINSLLLLTICNEYDFSGFVNANKDSLHGECLGNFSVLIGDQDQFIHIWRYNGGYQNIDENLKYLEDNKDFKLIMNDMRPLLRNRETEYFLPFSFWPDVQLR